MAADALLLCRTPLQARLCLKILEVEELERPDVLYLTHDDSETDRIYFERLRRLSGRAQYLNVRRQRADLLNHLVGMLRADRAFLVGRYARVYLASIGNPVFRWLLRRHPEASIRTFDDGTANILPKSAVLQPTDTGRMRVYARLLRLPSPGAVVASSSCHYTMYEGFDNIVPAGKLRVLEVFGAAVGADLSHVDAGHSYLIGQPLHEFLPPAAVARVREFLRARRFDFYVPHPREISPAIEGIEVLDKQGEVAEVAILRSAAQRKPQVFALFSTVLFNLKSDVADKFYISVPDAPGEAARLALIRRAGCTVLSLDHGVSEVTRGRRVAP